MSIVVTISLVLNVFGHTSICPTTVSSLCSPHTLPNHLLEYKLLLRLAIYLHSFGNNSVVQVVTDLVQSFDIITSKIIKVTQHCMLQLTGAI